MSRWKTITITRTWKSMRGRPQEAFPDAPGVYVVYSLDEGRSRRTLIYAGSSESLRRRWTGYLQKQCNVMVMRNVFFRVTTMQGLFPDLVVKFREARVPGEHLMGEYRLIRRLRPPWNANPRSGGGVGSKRQESLHETDGGPLTILIPLAEWAATFLVASQESLIAMDAAYDSYRVWAKRQGFRAPGRFSVFTGGMFEWFKMSTGKDIGRVRSPSGRECYRGIAWASGENGESP